MSGYKKCPFCGEQIPEDAVKCMYCTAWLNEQRPYQAPGNEGAPVYQQPGYQGAAPMANVYVNAVQPQAAVAQPQVAKRKNGIGTTGLVFSILSLVFCWVPFLDLLFWFLGFLFSFIGVFKRPKGVAIAGLVIAVISLVVIICLWAALGTAFLESSIWDDLLYSY